MYLYGKFDVTWTANCGDHWVCTVEECCVSLSGSSGTIWEQPRNSARQRPDALQKPLNRPIWEFCVSMSWNEALVSHSPLTTHSIGNCQSWRMWHVMIDPSTARSAFDPGSVSELHHIESVLTRAFADAHHFTAVVTGQDFHTPMTDTGHVTTLWISTVVAGLLGEVYVAETNDAVLFHFSNLHALRRLSPEQQQHALGPLMATFNANLQKWWGEVLEVFSKIGFEMMPKGNGGKDDCCETYTGVDGSTFKMWVMARGSG
ncbi:hypothetical protein B0H13DRAFT_1909110 [Mycena leptocephala]|nr:hypothetical protein B0H13DRAFT_1909110 [Mycena leptocephala]